MPRRDAKTAGAMESKGFGAYPERTYRTEVNIPLWAVISAVMYVLATVLCGGLFKLLTFYIKN